MGGLRQGAGRARQQVLGSWGSGEEHIPVVYVHDGGGGEEGKKRIRTAQLGRAQTAGRPSAQPHLLLLQAPERHHAVLQGTGGDAHGQGEAEVGRTGEVGRGGGEAARCGQEVWTRPRPGPTHSCRRTNEPMNPNPCRPIRRRDFNVTKHAAVTRLRVPPHQFGFGCHQPVTATPHRGAWI